MKRNEKILATALGLMIVGWFAWPMIDSIFFAPLRDREETLSLLRSQVKDKEYEVVDLKTAQKRLSEWRRQGLPGIPLNAQRLYQLWLSDLAAASGLEGVTITPGSRNPHRGVYHQVFVQLKGQARFSELQTFLRRAEEVDLLHRVSAIKITPPAGAAGDPELTFDLSFEGLNLNGAPERLRLFPQIELANALDSGATELKVAKKELPARPGDRLRIGNEFATVASVEADRLELTRGADGTNAVDHPVGTTVELFPMARDEGREHLAAFATITSPFAKPRRYEPKFEGLADQKLVRGNPLKTTVKIADYDASKGTAKIELLSGPDGLKFDATTGELIWSPADDIAAGPHRISLAATLPGTEKRLEHSATISLVEPNTAPKVEPIATADVFLGETLRLPLKANDAEDGDSLTLKLANGPDGATIDVATKEFRWSVPKTHSPGAVSITVEATDKGDPPLSAKQTFTITVHENLKPFVRLSGSVESFSRGDSGSSEESSSQAFLYDQSSNKWIPLREGKSFEAAGLKAVVKQIGRNGFGRDFVTYEWNGEVWRIELGQSLEDAERISGPPLADVSANVEPAEAKRPEDATEPESPAAASGEPRTAS